MTYVLRAKVEATLEPFLTTETGLGMYCPLHTTRCVCEGKYSAWLR